MKRPILLRLPLLYALCLCACTSTRVHLFTDGIEPSQLTQVQNALQAGGYEIVLNSLSVPDEIRGPTVLYSPVESDIEAVESLGNRLLAMGYDVILEPFAKGNHFYTEDNIGVYLKPFQAGRAQTKTLEGREFNGDCDEVDAYLRFTDARRFSVEFIGWNEVEQQEVVNQHTGSWRRNDDTVELTMGVEKTELQLIPVQYTTQYGSIKGFRLINRSDRLRGCDFVYREVGTL